MSPSKRNNRPRKDVGRVIKPRKPVDLGPVLFPQRFDLIKRAEFVPFYLENRDLWDQDEEAFLDLARESELVTYLHPLATGERYSHFLRSAPWSEKRIVGRSKRLFRKNARCHVKLYHSIVDGGWDPGYPIRLKRLRNPQLPISGRSITNNTVFSDGQHRLIILISQGQRELLPEQCRIVEINSRFDPLETTDCYIRHGLCTEREFCDFARWRYDVPEHVVDVRTLYEWGMDNDIAPWWEEYMHGYWPQTKETS